ncbi:uncharacterized protein [Coffea arabica]|uniref:RNase H type-1 domain-containing protein n=1 Tax=Coffea arabica TaxID=13443 RepID=A0ABM4VZF2_COFAR
MEQFVEQLVRARRLSGATFRGDLDDPWSRWVVNAMRQYRAVPVSWKRPPLQWVTLNTDASVSQARAYGRGLLRDSDGRLIFAFYKELGELDVLAAESSSLLYGLQRCMQGLQGRLMVRVDSESLVSLLRSTAITKWPLCNTIRHIRVLLLDLSALVQHIFREANSAADMMSKLRPSPDFFCTSQQQLRGRIRAALSLDSRELCYLRM